MGNPALRRARPAASCCAMRFSALALLLSGALCAQEYDLVIRNGRIVDGTGRAAFAGDVAVRDGRIAAVGAVSGRGRQEIDAGGRVVAPGFIDVHTHSEDIAELPVAENFIRMGVTTIVTGNCGSSDADVAGFFANIEKTKVALNVATLIGQGTVRFQVMGGSFMRPPTAEELDKMRAMVAQAMKDGAVGLSTGLIYLPGTYTKTEEIIELAKVAAAHGGIYASHMRHENRRIREALDELTRIAREARIPAQVSHIKLASPAAWGRADEIIEYLDKARAEGLAVTHDQYVYTASSTSIGSRLPDRVREGGEEKFRERMADPAQRRAVIEEMKESLKLNRQPDFGFAVIARFAAEPRLNGKNIIEAARLLRGADSIEDQIETIIDIQLRGGAQGVFHGMEEGDLRKFLAQPLTMIASDAGPRKFGDAVPHPRGYGNNARVLGRYVREEKLLTLEDAVRKMTSLPADTFKLAGRGRLQAGAVADLVVFDPATVNDPSAYADPHHYAVGFRDVVVNGVPVIRAGELTGARPGKPVRLTR
jgi:N-acyl-D-amino-acid deacylase